MTPGLQIASLGLLLLLVSLAALKVFGGVIHFTPWFSPNVCAVPCSITIACHRCENAECQEIHGYALELRLLWWTLIIDWMFAENGPDTPQ